jgi:arginyl-tRNA synthetase
VSETIKAIVISALKAEGIPEETLLTTSFVIEHPADLSKGDYSTNAALVFAKILKKNPVELAKALLERIKLELSSDITNVEVAGPGFINFYLSPEYFNNSIKEIVRKGEEFGELDTLSGKKYFIEYTQPNPFKDFHIGHLMNNAIGEALSRILEKSGAEVKRATYHGDVGMHVAKTIFGLQTLGEEISIESLGKGYVLGNKEYENNEEAKKVITDINKKIYEKIDPEINALYEKGKAISLSFFESMYVRLGSTFDYHFFESEAGVIGKEIVEAFIGPVFEKSQGAVVFHGEDQGLHTRVFLNAEGLPTYEAKEVGLAQIKKEIYPYDVSLTITANEQDDFFRVVEVAIAEVFPELSGKLKHLSHGILKLTTGKMSSRSGGVISAESFIEEVKQGVLAKINESERENITEAEKPALAENIALGAIKYWILKQSIGKDIIFDKEKELSIEGDSGPYLQYAHTRALSVLRKAKAEGIEADIESDLLLEENDLIKKLYRLPEIIEESAKLFAPQLLVTYLTDLASTFNNFYAHNQVVNKNDSSSGMKVALVSAFATVMENGMKVLGITPPERM